MQGTPSALTHHVLGIRQAELLWLHWEGLWGKQRDGDGEEKRKGREERRFLYGNKGEGHKGQQKIDGTKSKLRQE